MLEIRPMEIQDVEAVAAIERENFSKPWTEEGFKKAITDSNTLYLSAFQDEVLVGYIGMWMVLDEGEITNVSVKKAVQGQKIGSRMMERLLEEGEKRKISTYFLEVRKSNGPAVSVYTKMGFEQAGIRKNFYEDPVEDGIVMCKR